VAHAESSSSPAAFGHTYPEHTASLGTEAHPQAIYISSSSAAEDPVENRSLFEVLDLLDS